MKAKTHAFYMPVRMEAACSLSFDSNPMARHRNAIPGLGVGEEKAGQIK